MARTLRALIVEDTPDDCELLLLELKRQDYAAEWRQVATAAEMRAALADGPWDVVISDYTLPGFGALEALELARTADLDLPFLVISGTIGEEFAATLMRAGANDFILKDNPVRLAPAIERELREAKRRRAGREAELMAAQLAAIVRSSSDAIISLTLGGVLASWNPAAEALFGWTAEEAIGRSVSILMPPEMADEPTPLGRVVEQRERIEPYETIRVKKDGTPIHVSVTLSPIGDRDGRLVGFSKTIRDITEKKKAEEAILWQTEALARSEERYRFLIEAMSDIVWMSRPDGYTEFVNHRGLEYSGRPLDDYLGWAWVQLLHPDDVDRTRTAWLSAVSAGTQYEAEYRLRRSDGCYRWFVARAVPLRDASGQVEKWVGTCTDIDDRKQAEAQVRSSEVRFKALIESSYDPVVLLERSGIVRYASPAIERVGGWKPEELADKSVFQFTHPEETAGRMTGFQEILTRPGAIVSMQSRFRHKDGSWRTAEFTCTNLLQDPHVKALVVNFRDVTDRDAAEKALTQQTRILQSVVNSMGDGVVVADEEGKFLVYNPAAEQILRVASNEARPNEWPERFGLYLPDATTPYAPEQVPLVRALRGESVDQELMFVRHRAETQGTWISVTARPLADKTGTIRGGVVVFRDVTARRQETEELRLRDRAMQAATQGICITEPGADNLIVYASPGFERLTGYTVAEVLGKNCRLLQGRDTDRESAALIRSAIREGQPCTVELLNYRKDGSTFWNELSISPVRDVAGRLTHFVGVQADVTRRRKLEEQLRQAQKMEAVGLLAGGIAHDFNNHLTIISGYSDLLLHQLATNDPARAMVEEIHRAGERSAALTRQLLVFSRQQVVATRLLEINAVVADAEKMLRRIIGEDVRLKAVLRAREGRVTADAGQLEQVLLNLAVNARDAMPRGGTLTIETSDVTAGAGDALLSPGNYVLLAVSDTGCGMPPEVKARVFEPFFTTKAPGKGTGLGLAVVHGIVEEARGRVEIDSTPGAGTTFRLYFPRSAKAVRSAKSHAGIRRTPSGKETVLLVEDERGVRGLALHVLSGCGYTVLEACDGDEALRLARSHSEVIHLLVTDVVMPGMSGRELSECFAKLHPESRVLYLSGYTNDAVVRHGVQQDRVALLQKPFTALALALKVREVLDSQGPTVARPDPGLTPA